MSEHRWSVAIVVEMNDAEAAKYTRTPLLERLDGLCEFLVPAGQLPRVKAIRGPLCSECRVAYDVVKAEPKDWPCPGRRPAGLGGPLLPTERTPSRQERRATARRARQDEAATRRKQTVAQQVEAAMARHQVRVEADETDTDPPESSNKTLTVAPTRR